MRAAYARSLSLAYRTVPASGERYGNRYGTLLEMNMILTVRALFTCASRDFSGVTLDLSFPLAYSLLPPA
jgi:hypothetical protein